MELNPLLITNARLLGGESASLLVERGRIAWTGTPAALAADQHAVETLLGVGGLH